MQLKRPRKVRNKVNCRAPASYEADQLPRFRWPIVPPASDFLVGSGWRAWALDSEPWFEPQLQVLEHVT